MNISRRTALQTCSAASASTVLSVGLSTPATAKNPQGELARWLEAAMGQCEQLQKSSRASATVNARWNLLATHAGNCHRIASVILQQLNSGGEASPANVQACADSCSRLIMTTHVLAANDAKQAVDCLAKCKYACLHWLSMKLA